MTHLDLAPEPDPGPPPVVAWLCRWADQELVVWATTIEGARLQARQHAGPTVPVSARLASRHEQAQWERTP